jgi:hypothetical protein
VLCFPWRKEQGRRRKSSSRGGGGGGGRLPFFLLFVLLSSSLWLFGPTKTAVWLSSRPRDLFVSWNYSSFSLVVVVVVCFSSLFVCLFVAQNEFVSFPGCLFVGWFPRLFFQFENLEQNVSCSFGLWVWI